MEFLSRQSIIDADDLPFEVVQVPEWGGQVRIRSITGTERDEFETWMIEQRGDNVKVNTRNLRAKLLSMTMVDQDGVLLFGTADIEVLGRKSARALDRVFTVAQRLAGMSKEDTDRLAGNSDATPSDTGSTSSPTD